MRFEELNWFDIEKYLLKEDRLMLVMGACEQHGYLSLLTDVKIPLALADAASQKSGVMVAPSLNFGSSPYFLAYPGTISLRVQTLLDIAEDLIRSVYSQGFRRLLILNGHGGNAAVRARLYELVNEMDDLLIRWFSWWDSHGVEEFAVRHDIKPTHANWLEAFPFTRVMELPDGKKTPADMPGIIPARKEREILGDGVFGGDYSVDDVLMEELFNIALQDVLNLLHFE